MAVVWWVLAVFGWLVATGIAGRVMLSEGDRDDPFEYASLLVFWPCLAAVGLLFCMGFVGGWLAKNLTGAPTAFATRVRDNRKLRQAERVKRLREAEAILAREGLDFKP